MRDSIINDLSTVAPVAFAIELVDSYEQLVAKHRSGDFEGALTKGGRFVEQVFRLIEFIRTGVIPPEIKQVANTMRLIENDTTLSESLRLLIPKTAYGMYNIRSKRNGVHVKEVDPTPIDVSLMVSASGWVMAELLRLYHKSDPKAVADAMMALTRSTVPLIETINGEVFVGRTVPAKNEVLLLLAHAKPTGMSRAVLGNSAKCSQPSVSKALKELSAKRMVHASAENLYFITSAGELLLDQWLLLKNETGR